MPFRHLPNYTASLMSLEDLLHLVFLMAVGQGLLMGIVFVVHRSKDDLSVLFIGLLLLTYSLVLVHWLAYWRGLYSAAFGGVGFFLEPFDLLIGPLVYYAISSRISFGYRLSGKEWLHLLPWLLFLLNGLNTYLNIYYRAGMYQLISSRDQLPAYYLILTVLKHLQFAGYGLWLLWLSPREEGYWLKYLTLVYQVYLGGRLAYLFFFYTGLLTDWIDYLLSIIITAGIYSIAYKNQVKPDFMRRIRSYERSSLSQAHESLVANQVMTHLQNTKSYLDSDLSIQILAEQMSMPRHHISQAINHFLGKSFNTLINEMRIEEAILLMNDPANTESKIMAIALQAGFNNKVSFNKYFKAKTGLSPKAYRSINHQSSNQVKSDNN